MGKMIDTHSVNYSEASCKIPMDGWWESVYVDYKGALREMRFVKIEFDLVDYILLYHVKIAGIGDVSLKCNIFKLCPLSYFPDIDCYEYNKEFKRGFSSFSIVQILSECFNVKSDKLGDLRFYNRGLATFVDIVRYKWDGVKPVEQFIKIPHTVFYDKQNGWHFEELCSLPNDTFRTCKECKMANTVKVIKFTDEEVSNIDKNFDDYDRVKNACDKLIRSIVWEHNDIAIGEKEETVEAFLKKCQKNMREKIIEYVSEICKQRYDVDVINE